jgi:EF hand
MSRLTRVQRQHLAGSSLAGLASGFAFACAAPAAAQPANMAGMDANGDGRTSRAEYRVGLVDGSMKFDKNSDGRVTIAEMPAATRLPGIKGIMVKVFKQNDTSGDGALSRDELAARAEVRFTELDKNVDGYLDAAEIKAGRRTR